jgi:dihydroorotate dehydrogenase
MLALSSRLYRLLLRPLLFRLPPEAAQRAADLALRQHPVWRALAPAFRVRDARLRVDTCGLRLDNPVGLAAGYDKNCELLPSLGALGFGYLMCGTVTESPQSGNPRPRLFRLVRQRSLINAMGFPNKGLESAAGHLEKARRTLGGTPLGVSVSGTTPEQIVRCHRRLEPLADLVEINISSPNTAGLRVFHEPPALAELIGRINEARARPLVVKLPPYPSTTEAEPSQEVARERLLALVRVCLDEGVDAVTAANSRPATDRRLSSGAGGLSGRAIYPDMLRMVVDIEGEVGDRLAINACGGIFSGEDAWKALKAGATTVQLYTGLVYCGPGVVREINRELLAIMDREGVESLALIHG